MVVLVVMGLMDQSSPCRATAQSNGNDFLPLWEDVHATSFFKMFIICCLQRGWL